MNAYERDELEIMQAIRDFEMAAAQPIMVIFFKSKSVLVLSDNRNIVAIIYVFH